MTEETKDNVLKFVPNLSFEDKVATALMKKLGIPQIRILDIQERFPNKFWIEYQTEDFSGDEYDQVWLTKAQIYHLIARG